MNQFFFNLDLSFDPETREVTGSLIPSFTGAPLNKHEVQKKLQELGYAHFFMFEDHIEELLALDEVYRDKDEKNKGEEDNGLANKGEEDNGEQDSDHAQGSEVEDKDNGIAIDASQIFSMLEQPIPSLVIAEQRDAQIELDTDEDDLKAYLSITRPFGGDELRSEDIEAFVKKSGIQVKIDHESIELAAQKGSCTNLLIAKGVPPRKGRDSVFESLVSEQISSGPTIDEKGNANYHDINQFVVVEPGDQLMRRLPPSNGKNGVDVFGKTIPAQPGDPLPFSANLEGSEVSIDDPDLLVATIKGHPIILENGVNVDTVLILKAANLATGNVDFDGSVCIQEDVADGIEIKATGDVNVKGTVGKARIEAGNNISIEQGLIGGTKSREDDEYGAHLKAPGVINAKFASYADINAGDAIEIEEYASHCKLEANKKILLGHESGKGNLIGGRAQAFELIFAKTIGSTGGTPTSLRIGVEARDLDDLRSATQKIHQHNTRLAEISEALNKLAIWTKVAGINAQTKEKTENFNSEQIQLVDEIAALEEKANKIKKVLRRTKKSKVVAKHKIFPNVTIAILNVNYKTKDEMSQTSFRFENKRVLLEH